MGIHDLFKIIKEYAPNEITSYHLSEFCGFRWAVDISIFLNKFIKTAGERLWMNSFIMFLCSLKKHGIKLVCIFDGPNPPIEKKIEQEKRRVQSKKDIKRMKRCIEIRDELIGYYGSNDLIIPQNLQDEAKKLLGKLKYNKVIDWSDWSDVADVLNHVAEKLQKRTAPISQNCKDKAKLIVNLLGIPYFQADGEAEGLCAWLAIHNYVDGVLTEDTDVFAYGTPWMFALKDFKIADEKIYGIYLPSILAELEYTQEEFRDMCIMLGCDYNKKNEHINLDDFEDDELKTISLKGYPPLYDKESGELIKKKNQKPANIGPAKCVLFINEYRTIENCLSYLINPEILLYKRCREIFTPPNTEETRKLIKKIPLNKMPKYEELDEFLSENRLNITLEYIQEIWAPPKIIFTNVVSVENGNNIINNNTNNADTNNNNTENNNATTNEHDDILIVAMKIPCITQGDTNAIKYIMMSFESLELYKNHKKNSFKKLIDAINEYLNMKEETKGCYVDFDNNIEVDQVFYDKTIDDFKEEGMTLLKIVD